MRLERFVMMSLDGKVRTLWAALLVGASVAAPTACETSEPRVGIAAPDTSTTEPNKDPGAGDEDAAFADGDAAGGPVDGGSKDAAGGRVDGGPRDAGVDGTADARVACRPATGHWTKTTTGITTNLSAVWGSGATDVWTVGGTRILRWNGATWSTTLDDNHFDALSGIWGTGPNDVLAVGSIMLQWNGASWKNLGDTSTGPLWSRVGSLAGVSGTSSSDVWLVGESAAYHFNGRAWSAMSTGVIRVLRDVWAASPTEAWAVGAQGTIVRWNGRTWSPASSDVSEWLEGVWGTTANDVWAVGDGGTILHWNGTAWAAFPSPTTVMLNDVWGTAADDVWAVGNTGATIHFDGCEWTPVANDLPRALRLHGVWGSSALDYWAVGDDGTVIHYGP